MTRKIGIALLLGTILWMIGLGFAAWGGR
jgi:hypothetical protein